MTSSLDDVARTIEGSMVRLRQGMSRRTLGHLLTSTINPPVSLATLGVIDTVEQSAASGRDGVSVGEVAERMAVDPSRASRLVAEAVDQGFLRRVACQKDGRRSGLELTPQSTAITEQAHQVRRNYYLQLMSGWSEEEQRQFAALLSRFTDAMTGIESAGPRRQGGRRPVDSA